MPLIFICISQTFVDLLGGYMGLLLGNGEGLRGNVSDDSGLLAVRSAGEHRKSVRAGDTSLFYNCHISDLHHSVVALGLLEVPDDRHVPQRISKVEGTNAEFRRGAVARTRDVESVSEGDRRGDREIR